jgi:hypothetical protein
MLAVALSMSISIGSMDASLAAPSVAVVLTFLCGVQLAVEYAIVIANVFVGISSQIVTYCCSKILLDQREKCLLDSIK